MSAATGVARKDQARTNVTRRHEGAFGPGATDQWAVEITEAQGVLEAQRGRRRRQRSCFARQQGETDESRTYNPS
jgi:hypothetical protein